ncbi:MAG: hypothetical protein QOH41_1464 [Blastocatellia bacterium]|nr:hypothetical protein [Blastocatellia bacterium]
MVVRSSKIAGSGKQKLTVITGIQSTGFSRPFLIEEDPTKVGTLNTCMVRTGVYFLPDFTSASLSLNCDRS